MEPKPRPILDFWAVFFLIILFQLTALRLRTTAWTEHLDVIELLLWFAVGVGLVLGVSRFSKPAVLGLALGYSLVLVPWQMVLVSSDRVYPWLERLGILGWRLQTGWQQMIQNQALSDPTLFLLCVTLLFWGSALVAAYKLARTASPWPALVVPVAAIVITEIYDPGARGGSLLSGLFFFFALLLVGRLFYIRSRLAWQASDTTVDADTGYQLGKAVAIAGAILVLISWNLPTMIGNVSTSLQPHSNAKGWAGLRERFTNLVAPLRGSTRLESLDFGSDLALGTRSLDGDGPVLEVEPLSMLPESAHFYWRARTYDEYSNGEWRSTLPELSEEIASNRVLAFAATDHGALVDFQFTVRTAASEVILFPPQPVQVDRKTLAAGVKDSGKWADLDVLKANPPLSRNESYRLKAWVSQPTRAALQSSSETLPAWVTRRYLQIPENLPSRIGDLARKIGAGAPTRYDMVLQITEYLRQNLAYETDLPALPQESEPVDYFLFDYRRGFCNYFATAEVLLLRSLGVPARLVAGYAEGSWDERLNRFMVLQKDSHAWPEVYFPGIGWVEFEPTISRPEIIYPGDEVPAVSLVNPADIPMQSPGNPFLADDERYQRLLGADERASQTENNSLFRFLPGAIAGLLLLFIMAVGWVFWRVWVREGKQPMPVVLNDVILKQGLESPSWLRKWARFSTGTKMEKIYWRVVAITGRLLQIQMHNPTPGEFFQVLQEKMPEGVDDATTLLEEFHLAEFSPHPADINRARQAGQRLELLAWGRYWRLIIGKV